MLRATLREMLRNPMVLALLAALVFTALGLHLPGPLQAALDMIARASAPIALFVVGGTLATLPLAGMWDRALLVTAGKLALHPAAVALCLWATGTSDPWWQGGVLFAAMPMMTIYPIIASRGGMSGLAASALLAAVVISFFTITGVLHLLGL